MRAEPNSDGEGAHERLGPASEQTEKARHVRLGREWWLVQTVAGLVGSAGRGSAAALAGIDNVFVEAPNRPRPT